MKLADALRIGFQVLEAAAGAEAGVPVTLRPIDIRAGTQTIELDITAKVKP